MPHELLLISGRSLKQGTSSNQGKLTAAYREETATLDLHPADAAAAGMADGGRATLASVSGQITVTCRIRKPDELQPGMAFLPYGTAAGYLLGGETQGTGMPEAKNLRVWLSPVKEEGSDG